MGCWAEGFMTVPWGAQGLQGSRQESGLGIPGRIALPCPVYPPQASACSAVFVPWCAASANVKTQ